MEDVDGAAGVDDVNGAAGIRDVVRFFRAPPPQFDFFDDRAPDSSMVEDLDDSERRGMKDADGAEGVNDVGGVAGVNNVARDSGRDNSAVTGTDEDRFFFFPTPTYLNRKNTVSDCVSAKIKGTRG